MNSIEPVVHVLGIDPGFASLGWAKVRLTPRTEHLLDCGVIRTSKSSKKLEVKASDDNMRRARLLARELHEVAPGLPGFSPSVICVEAQSWPRNASSAIKVALSWGALAYHAELLSTAVQQARTTEIKEALTGEPTASKAQVLMALRQRPGFESIEQFLTDRKIPKGQWEHAADAAGAVVACLDTDLMRVLRSHFL